MIRAGLRGGNLETGLPRSTIQEGCVPTGKGPSSIESSVPCFLGRGRNRNSQLKKADYGKQ